MSASLNEQKNELAVLRSLGTKRGEITLVVTLEVIIMVTLGTVGLELWAYLLQPCWQKFLVCEQ